MTNETGPKGTDKLKNFIDLLSPDQKGALLEILLQENKEKKNYGEPIPELVGDFDKVLEYILNNCVVRVHTNRFYHDGTIFTIELPAVGEFEGFKFNCFCSDFTYDQKNYENEFDGSSMGYSMDDIGEILQKINEFLMAYGVGDKDITDFSDLLKSWVRGVNIFGAGKVLGKILVNSTTTSCGTYWLTDKFPHRDGRGRVYLSFGNGKCAFGYGGAESHIIINL